MDTADLPFTPIAELAPQIETGNVSPSDILDACVHKIEKYDSILNAYITKTFELAREYVGVLEKELECGIRRGPLHGIPIALKDLIDLEGFPSTAGSSILKDCISSQTAHCAHRLMDAGAIILGKTNLQEFARGGTGANSFFGPTKNPWDLERSPGGSSSGSGASVAAGMSVAALGTDTGGSVRIPASYCGLVGMRSTFGRVSCSGVLPLGLSFDNVGPLTRTVEDAAIVLQAMAGPNSDTLANEDSHPPNFMVGLGTGIEGIKLGVPVNYFWPGYEAEVEDIVREAISEFKKFGAKLVEVKIPWAELGAVAYAAVVGPESAEIHRENLRERRDEYTGPGADFFEESLFIPGWRYVQAQKARTYFMRQAAEVFRSVDAILTPTTPTAAPTIKDCLDGTKTWSATSHCTVPFSSIGCPALQVPCGFTGSGLPVGLQIAAKWGEEALCFQIGRVYEDAHPWWRRRPQEPAMEAEE